MHENMLGFFICLVAVLITTEQSQETEYCQDPVIGLGAYCRAEESWITASSSKPGHPAPAAINTSGSAWIPHYEDKEPYIQLDMGWTDWISGIQTQGEEGTNNWVSTYAVSHSFQSPCEYEYITDKCTGEIKVFYANIDDSSIVINIFDEEFIVTRFVRIYPLTSNNVPALRFDLLACRTCGHHVPPIYPTLDNHASEHNSIPACLMKCRDSDEVESEIPQEVDMEQCMELCKEKAGGNK